MLTELEKYFTAVVYVNLSVQSRLKLFANSLRNLHSVALITGLLCNIEKAFIELICFYY